MCRLFKAGKYILDWLNQNKIVKISGSENEENRLEAFNTHTTYWQGGGAEENQE